MVQLAWLGRGASWPVRAVCMPNGLMVGPSTGRSTGTGHSWRVREGKDEGRTQGRASELVALDTGWLRPP